MRFSWPAALITVGVVIIEGIAAFLSGTFSHYRWRHVDFSMLMHWGVMVGDLILLPIFNGLVVPHLKVPWKKGALFLLISFAITLYCHWQWWHMCNKTSSFMCLDMRKSMSIESLWFLDGTLAGAIHFLYMAFEIPIIMAFFYSPMPRQVAKWAFAIFMIFVPFALIEPGIAVNWPLTGENLLVTAAVSISTWSIVLLISYAKLKRLKE